MLALLPKKERRGKAMKPLDWLRRLSIWRDTRAQDMVEYALLAGFVTVAAGAAFPPIASDISTIFSKLTSIADGAATT
jgi:Flp pilus assembly pilin Flp